MERSIGQQTILERSTTEKYFNVIEHAADGVVMVQDGVLDSVNSALVRMSGYRKEELIGMPFARLLAPQCRKFVMARYEDISAGKEVPSVYAAAAVTKEGEILNIEISIALTRHEGHATGVVIIRDSTERKRVQEETRVPLAKVESVKAECKYIG